jgi:hypothetical protein
MHNNAVRIHTCSRLCAGAEVPFEHKFNDIFQEIINSNSDLYRRATDDESFGTALKDYLFDEYPRRHREVKELISQGESKRWISNPHYDGI